MQRRRFLAAGGGLLLAAQGVSGRAATAATDDRELYAAAWMDDSMQPGVAIVDERGEILWQETLPARGHGLARSPDGGSLIVFARRPGTVGLVFDPRGQRPSTLFQASPGRHFYGHGVYSGDGRLLYTTENDIASGQGVIGVRDATDGYRWVGEFASGGIGPHDLALLPDGTTLAVANGGILTHPDSGRQKLNLATMAPTIALLDTRHGDIIARQALPSHWHRLSLRHMSLDNDGTLWIGGQYEGDAGDDAPLIACLPRNGELHSLDLPIEDYRALGGYIGSVAINVQARRVAFTAPHTDRVLVLDCDRRVTTELWTRPASCAIAPHGRSFVTADEQGRIADMPHDRHWDNHLLRV